MTRKELHTWIDEKLDEWGFQNNIIQEWGHIQFQVNFENNRIALKVKERRETEK